MSMVIDGADLRHIMRHYPTGVCAITALDGADPVAMVVGSFTSVSLDPPLVAFLPDRKSTSWPRIRSAGRFCVNVMAAGQFDLCQALAAKSENKFANIPYSSSEAGMPLLAGVLASIDCEIYAIHEAGDHYIAIGQVQSMEILHTGKPLLFFQGGYGSFVPFGEVDPSI